MLVLSRKELERIRISDNVVLTILSADKGRVKVGVEAPRGIKILRDELTDKPQSQRDGNE